MIAVLSVSVSVMTDGSGHAIIKVGPLSARERWQPTTVSVSGNTGSVTNEATCVVSVGDLATKAFVDSCVDGSTGDATGKVAGRTIRAGEYVWAEWTGADPNIQVTLTVMGTRTV